MPYTHDGHYTYDGEPGWTIALASRLEVTAFHEAAHAVVGQRSGSPWYEISIAPNERSLGRVRFSPDSNPPTVRSRNKELFRELPDALTADASESKRAPKTLFSELLRRTASPLPEEGGALDQKMRCHMRRLLVGPLAGSRLSGTPPFWGNDRAEALLTVAICGTSNWKIMRRLLKEELVQAAAIIRDPEVWAEIDALARRVLVEVTIVNPRWDFDRAFSDKGGASVQIQ